MLRHNMADVKERSRSQNMFETIFIIMLAAFAAGGIWAFAVTKKAKKEGLVKIL